jgi:hypothetical protein
MKPKLYRKFRAVEHKTYKFVYGAYVEYIDQDRPDEIIEDNGTVHKVASWTVGEFTGFVDGSSPRREIYDGDILQEPDHSDTYVVFWDKGEGQWAVKFRDTTMPLARLRRAYGFVAKVISTTTADITTEK